MTPKMGQRWVKAVQVARPYRIMLPIRSTVRKGKASMIQVPAGSASMEYSSAPVISIFSTSTGSTSTVPHSVPHCRTERCGCVSNVQRTVAGAECPSMLFTVIIKM